MLIAKDMADAIVTAIVPKGMTKEQKKAMAEAWEKIAQAMITYISTNGVVNTNITLVYNRSSGTMYIGTGDEVSDKDAEASSGVLIGKLT